MPAQSMCHHARHINIYVSRSKFRYRHYNNRVCFIKRRLLSPLLLHIVFDRHIRPPVCEVEHAHSHQRQAVIPYRTPVRLHAASHPGAAEIRSMDSPHIPIGTPVLSPPAGRLRGLHAEAVLDNSGQLPSAGHSSGT